MRSQQQYSRFTLAEPREARTSTTQFNYQNIQFYDSRIIALQYQIIFARSYNNLIRKLVDLSQILHFTADFTRTAKQVLGVRALRAKSELKRTKGRLPGWPIRTARTSGSATRYDRQNHSTNWSAPERPKAKQ